MKPNGYMYPSYKPVPCDKCGKPQKDWGRVSVFRLFKVGNEKWCRECAKAARVV